jgi:iron-sulfur cluster repair protein YtfE (RIC family)
MNRDRALIPLTHDHHHALAQARRLRAAASGDSAKRRDGAAAFLDFFGTEVISHFREEEELLFPLLVEVSEVVPRLLERVLLEHVQIHCLVRRLRRGLENDALDAAGMLEVGELLEAHIRFEERQLFPLIEQAVPASLLGELTFAPRHRGDGGQEPEGAVDAPG